MSDEIKQLKDAEQGEAEFAADEKRGGGANMAWVPGLVLMAIGAIFLLNNFTDFQLDNWWALFILIPAFGSLGNFWPVYRTPGRLLRAARGSLIGALILFFVAAIFLFGWNWGTVWPFFLIIAGLGALLSGLFD